MATLKCVKKSNQLKNLVLIPGGPGLGPISFDLLVENLKDINVYYYYPTGTLGEYSSEHDFCYQSQLSELKTEINKLGNTFVLGHSFGGILATELSINSPELVDGLICIAAPFLKDSFNMASLAFSEVQSTASEKVNIYFRENPTDDNYKTWFSFYADLYFTKSNAEAGKKMILADSACIKSFLAARSESSKKEHLLTNINASKTRRLYLAGLEDKLLPTSVLEKDAKKGGFKYLTVKNAGHFVHFDQPKEVAEMISTFIKEGDI